MIYIYCVTDREPDLAPGSERDENGLYAVSHRGLFAVVRRVSADEFDETHIYQRLADPDWLRLKILEHEETVERIMLDCPLLPFKFATVFESEENVVNMLDENNAAFSTVIEGFRGKEEWGVKIYVNSERLRNALIDGDEVVGALDRDILSASPGKAYILRKKREDLMHTRAEQVMDEYGECCLEALTAGSVPVRINRLLPEEMTARTDEMLVNAAFLVEKEKTGVFRDTVEDLQERYDSKGFCFDITGPWPPYNFCSSGMDNGI